MGDLVGPGGSEKITAAHIRAGLRKMFPHPECGIVFEVAAATGFNANRHLDAIAMDTWPSRGLIINGIEIKVSRADFKREKADPAKAEELARFCDKFWIAAPPGLIDPHDLPHAWGLFEGGAGGMRIKKPAEKTKAAPIERAFLAAIFRAAGRGVSAVDSELALAEAKDRIRADFKDEVERTAERMSKNNSSDADNWRTLVKALCPPADKDAPDGLDPFRWALSEDPKKLIAVIKAVKLSGVMDSWHGLSALAKTLTEMTEKVQAAMTALNVPVADDTAVALSRFMKKQKGKSQ